MLWILSLRSHEREAPADELEALFHRMKRLRIALLHRLASGQVLAMESLAGDLGASIESLRGGMEALRTLGLEVEDLGDDRVRLRSPLEVLDRDAILDWLGTESRRALETVEVLFETGSTNQYLLELAREIDPVAPRACLAEVQSAGRGRGGRPFFSALGGNVLLSLLWPVGASPAELVGLSPTLAVAVARVLESEGADGIGLKWPNDILVGGRKVCGILLEVGSERREGWVLVAGIGINVRMAAPVGREIDQPWTDLHRELGRMPSRNRIAGRVIDQVMGAVRVYLEQGFGPFRSEYRARDILEGREVRLVQAPTEWRGVGRGLDETGALLVESAGRVTAHLSGDVRVRLGR